MPVFATVLLLLGVGAGLLARYTRLHPIVIAIIGALPGLLLGTFAAAALLSPAPWGLGLIVGVVTATVSALGAFLGWLRRENLRRKS